MISLLNVNFEKTKACQRVFSSGRTLSTKRGRRGIISDQCMKKSVLRQDVQIGI